VPVPMSFDHLDLQRIIGRVLSRKQADYEQEGKAWVRTNLRIFSAHCADLNR